MAEEIKQNSKESPNSLNQVNYDKGELQFHYIKSALFRTIHVDGAHGGATPQGKIQMSVFNERFPIPQITVAPLTESGPGEEIREKRISKDGVIREIEANLILDRQLALSIGEWLIRTAKEMDQVEQQVFSKLNDKTEEGTP